MAIPEQVRKQSEAVQELYKQLNGETGTGSDAEVGQETVDAGDDTPTADANANDNAAQVSGDEQTSGTSNTEDENSETYAQRWRSLQGSYNATVRQKTELEQRVAQMEQLLASLSAQQSAAPARTEQAQPERLVSDQEINEYGESIDVMRKVSREELIPVAQRLAQIEGLLQQMQDQILVSL